MKSNKTKKSPHDGGVPLGGGRRPADEDALVAAVMDLAAVDQQITQDSQQLAKSKDAVRQALQRVRAIVDHALATEEVSGLGEAAALVAFHEQDVAVYEARLAVQAQLRRALAKLAGRPEVTP